MKPVELSDVNKFYLLGHLDMEPKQLAEILGLKLTIIRKFIRQNTKVEEVKVKTVNSPLSESETPQNFQPAKDLLSRKTGEGKERGVTIMTGGASMAGDDARKAFRESSRDNDDSSYIYHFNTKKPVTGLATR